MPLRRGRTLRRDVVGPLRRAGRVILRAAKAGAGIIPHPDPGCSEARSARHDVSAPIEIGSARAPRGCDQGDFVALGQATSTTGGSRAAREEVAGYAAAATPSRRAGV